MSEQTAAVASVMQERAHQIEEWGGPEHDDQHDIAYWYDQIKERLYKPTDFTLGPPSNARRYFIQIAALAIAGAESLDRRFPDL